jgi:hypothetical protein
MRDLVTSSQNVDLEEVPSNVGSLIEFPILIFFFFVS